MIVGSWTAAGPIVVAVILVSGGDGSFAQSAIDDIRKAECELLGRCDQVAPPVVVAPVQQPVQSVGPGTTDWRDKGSEATSNCDSVTEIKGQGNACTGQILYDEFLSPQKIDNTLWQHEILMPLKPDFEFVVFDRKQKNSYVKNGLLYIKPTLAKQEELREKTLILEGCTGKTGGGYGYTAECERKGEFHNILPPVYSARVTTRNTFAFKYGRVDIRAKLPVGDWIIPEIRLEPKDNFYGPSPYNSGRIQIAMARGNKRLKCDGNSLGNELLEAGIYVSNRESAFVPKILKRTKINEAWGDSFHNYSILWTKDNIEFLVDGESLGLIKPPGHPLYHVLGLSKVEAKDWAQGTEMAPFDKEFYISLGVSVGGARVFPNNCLSDGVSKPWRNLETKSMANFWDRRDDWQRTWKGVHHALQVDFVRVTAL